jgi:hypothetical protein
LFGIAAASVEPIMPAKVMRTLLVAATRGRSSVITAPTMARIVYDVWLARLFGFVIKVMPTTTDGGSGFTIVSVKLPLAFPVALNVVGPERYRPKPPGVMMFAGVRAGNHVDGINSLTGVKL